MVPKPKVLLPSTTIIRYSFLYSWLTTSFQCRRLVSLVWLAWAHSSRYSIRRREKEQKWLFPALEVGLLSWQQLAKKGHKKLSRLSKQPMWIFFYLIRQELRLEPSYTIIREHFHCLNKRGSFQLSKVRRRTHWGKNQLFVQKLPRI